MTTLTYRYRAARDDGTIATGTVQADSRARADRLVTERGLTPIALSATAPPTWQPAVSRRELGLVFRNVASLVEVGVPLERALRASEPLASRRFRPVLTRWVADLRDGRSLSDSLARHTGRIPAAVTGMLRAGERGSDLDRALADVAAALEDEAELRASVRSALAYPLLILGVGLISVAVVTTVVIPRFATLLDDFGAELPALTAFLVGTADLMPVLTPAGIGLGLLATVGVLLMRRTPAGRQRVDGALLRVPVVGPIRRALGGMLRRGLPVLSALDAASEATGDAALGVRLARARARVAEGGRLSAALERERPLIPVALQLLHVGEQSGGLGVMAHRAGELAAAEAQRRIRAAVTVLEPALIAFFGAVVALVAAGLLQAVYALRPAGM